MPPTKAGKKLGAVGYCLSGIYIIPPHPTKNKYYSVKRGENVEKLLTTAEAAGILGIDPQIVRDYVREKKIPASWIGKGYKFKPSDIEAYIEKQKVA